MFWVLIWEGRYFVVLVKATPGFKQHPLAILYRLFRIKKVWLFFLDSCQSGFGVRPFLCGGCLPYYLLFWSEILFFYYYSFPNVSMINHWNGSIYKKMQGFSQTTTAIANRASGLCSSIKTFHTVPIYLLSFFIVYRIAVISRKWCLFCNITRPYGTGLWCALKHGVLQSWKRNSLKQKEEERYFPFLLGFAANIGQPLTMQRVILPFGTFYEVDCQLKSQEEGKWTWSIDLNRKNPCR